MDKNRYCSYIHYIHLMHTHILIHKHSLFFFFVYHNWWGPSDHPYDWGRHLWVRRWLMRPICARKSLEQWKQRMVAAVADVAVHFLSFLHSSVSSGFTDLRSTLDNFTPLVLVLRQIFQAIRCDTERFHGDLQCIFEALFLASWGALALRQFAVGQFLWEAMIFNVEIMTGPTKLWLHQDGVDAGKRSPN